MASKTSSSGRSGTEVSFQWRSVVATSISPQSLLFSPLFSSRLQKCSTLSSLRCLLPREVSKCPLSWPRTLENKGTTFYIFQWFILLGAPGKPWGNVINIQKCVTVQSILVFPYEQYMISASGLLNILGPQTILFRLKCSNVVVALPTFIIYNPGLRKTESYFDIL